MFRATNEKERNEKGFLRYKLSLRMRKYRFLVGEEGGGKLNDQDAQYMPLCDSYLVE